MVSVSPKRPAASLKKTGRCSSNLKKVPRASPTQDKSREVAKQQSQLNPEFVFVPTFAPVPARSAVQ